MVIITKVDQVAATGMTDEQQQQEAGWQDSRNRNEWSGAGRRWSAVEGQLSSSGGV